VGCFFRQARQTVFLQHGEVVLLGPAPSEKPPPFPSSFPNNEVVVWGGFFAVPRVASPLFGRMDEHVFFVVGSRLFGRFRQWRAVFSPAFLWMPERASSFLFSVFLTPRGFWTVTSFLVLSHSRFVLFLLSVSTASFFLYGP